MKVMVVDDQANSRLLLHDLLASHDYVSVQAEDGQAAWEMMHRERPDMVITDILMPRMDGFELCKKVKLDPELRGTAVIFYSAAFVAPEDEQLAMDLGASRFVSKPSEPQTFLDIIDAVMEQQRSGTLPIPERLSASLAECPPPGTTGPRPARQDPGTGIRPARLHHPHRQSARHGLPLPERARLDHGIRQRGVSGADRLSTRGAGRQPRYGLRPTHPRG